MLKTNGNRTVASRLFLIIYLTVAAASHLPLQQTPRHIVDQAEDRNIPNSYNYDRYLSYDQMESRLQALAQAYPNKLKLASRGTSVEGRNIYLVVISDNVRRLDSGQKSDTTDSEINQRIIDSPQLRKSYRTERRMPINKIQTDLSNTSLSAEIGLDSPTAVKRVVGGGTPVIFIDAGIHAREWAAPAAAFYLIDRLLESPSLTANLEWRIIPLVNPDGYAYSQLSPSTRFWRKNRAKSFKPSCDGVDLNRNFDVFWSETNSDPCSEVYGGSRAFSEPESQFVRNEVLKVKNRLQAYITLHTYGQLFLYPYGYTSRKTAPDFSALRRMANGMADVIMRKYNNKYRVDQAAVLGAAAGGSDDWAYIHAGAPYSYTFELQSKVDEGLHFAYKGFDLHETKLLQAVDECWLALQYLGNRILEQTRPNREDATETPIKELSIQETEQTTDSPHVKTDQDQQISQRDPELHDQESESTEDAEAGDIRIFPQFTWDEMAKKVHKAKQRATELQQGEIVTKDCIVVYNVYVCPHMVFWNSMGKT